MKVVLKISFACTLVLALLAPAANGQVTLFGPPNGADLSEPPAFGWGGPYDLWLFISAFYYDIPGVFTGYIPIRFGLFDGGFTLPGPWWDVIGEGEPNVWAVLGIDQATGGFAVSDVASFTKTGCNSQCCGSYVFGCGGSPTCVCYQTTEGESVCGPDFPCSSPPCGTSADCGPGEKCLACTCCETNVCGFVGEGACESGFSSFESYEGPTTTGEWIGR